MSAEREIPAGWRVEDGVLTRELEFRDFDEAMAFASELGRRAVDWFRRPDMTIESHRLRLSVANPHHAGVTAAEMRLVAKTTAVIDEYAARTQSSAGGGASA